MTAFSSHKVRRIVYIMAALAVGGLAAEARPALEYRDHQDRISKFDGPWSVVIQADSGACDPGAYRYGIDIVNGAVTHEGNTYGPPVPMRRGTPVSVNLEYR